MASEYWFKFKYKDWQNDVKPLSLTARAILLEMIIYMRQSPDKGTMPNDIRLISRLSGSLTEEATEGLSEILKFAILDLAKNERGEEIIVSRKITKEFEISRINAANGSLGGNPSIKDEIRLTEPLNRNHKRNHKRTSYSYSNSNSDSNFEDKGGVGEKETSDPSPAETTDAVNGFADRCLVDNSLLMSAQNLNKNITEIIYLDLVNAFRARQIHSNEIYHNYPRFKMHFLNSSIVLNYKPEMSAGKGRKLSGFELIEELNKTL